MQPREYLVRTPAGEDFARYPDLDLCKAGARKLGAGATVVGLDHCRNPIRENGADLIVFEVTGP